MKILKWHFFFSLVGIYVKELFCLLAIECTNLCDFWTKNGEALSRNVFWTNPPGGGAITDQCEKFGSKVQLLLRGSVSAEFRWCRTNGARALLSTNTRCVIAPP